jgi:hypothetical protein
MTILRLVGGSDVKPAAAGTARIKTCKKAWRLSLTISLRPERRPTKHCPKPPRTGGFAKRAMTLGERPKRQHGIGECDWISTARLSTLSVWRYQRLVIIRLLIQKTAIGRYREALVKQLLTPAPDLRSVTWKQAALASRQFRHTSVKSERIERAIAEDLAFLAAHPIRHNNSEAAARRRAFKEVMRRRIRDVAASRDLSDEEIKPALTLKHQEIAHFSEQHGVNIEWLLEGRGRTPSRKIRSRSIRI